MAQTAPHFPADRYVLPISLCLFSLQTVRVNRMKNRDVFSSLFWMGFGAVFLIGALNQGLIRKGIPGPGFVPFIVAIILISLSLMVFIPALGRKRGESETTGKPGFFPEKDSLKKILLALVALFAYGAVLEYGGFILTTFVFMLFMSRLIERIKWIKVLAIAFLTAVLSYLLFYALEVQLPQGILGI
jgi:putative tricarboxylic transport membrane protein